MSTSHPKTQSAKLMAGAIKASRGKKSPTASSEAGDSSIPGRVTRSKFGKRGRSPRSEAKSKSSAKKNKPEDKKIDRRDFTKDLLWEDGFLQENHLGQVEEWIKSQKWEKDVEIESSFDEKNVRMFYEKLSIEDSGNMTIGHYFVRGQKFTFTHKDVARLLEVPEEGFAKYYHGQWPADVDSLELIKTVTDNEEPLFGPIPTNKMGGAKKVLFHYLVSNIIPREQKRHTIYIQEILVIDKILGGEKVCLPCLIMLHMKNVIESQNYALPHGNLVISLMLHHKSYVKEGKAVTPRARMLNLDMMRKLGLSLVDGERIPKAEAVPNVANKGPSRTDMESATLLGEIETLKKQNLELGNALSRLLSKVDDLTTKVDNIAEFIKSLG